VKKRGQLFRNNGIGQSIEMDAIGSVIGFQLQPGFGLIIGNPRAGLDIAQANRFKGFDQVRLSPG
jgi:hypothetical protein